MSLLHLMRQAISLPPNIAVKKGGRYVGRIVKSQFRQIFDGDKETFLASTPWEFSGIINDIKTDIPSSVPPLVRNTLLHRFDLLGSGWVNVRQERQLEKISTGNRARSAKIRNLLNPGYIPIDWQLDFKSGYRWREDRLAGTLRYGHKPGVDVKVPWELARLQHLPWLALAHQSAGDDRYVLEFRNQVLDFAATNPPGYGVNWLCTMDVAIRAANLLMAYDLFRSAGAEFDDNFLGEFHALILAHGKHITENLEWDDNHRANHYLADVAGLLFVAAYLPGSPETGSWLAFAVRQLIAEVERQFTPDGANFEASTSYHRLSAEMIVYATALVLGLPDDKKSALKDYDFQVWRGHPSLPPAPVESHTIPGSDESSPFPPWYFERLEKMAEFSMHITKPNGRVVQVGDNDSGRFFKLCPILTEVKGEPAEEHLDHRATVAAINGLFRRPDFAAFAGKDLEIESDLVRSIAGGVRIGSYLQDGEAASAESVSLGNEWGNWEPTAETIINPPDPSVLEGLATCAYPDFGLYIWRSSRFFMSVRCGPIGQGGNGGHAHNDQLAVELNIDGKDWAADPGTYVYTPSPKDRDAYRSVQAHAAPRVGSSEPARLDLGLFRLGDQAQACSLRFSEAGFEGMHAGFGSAVCRRILIEEDRIRVRDKTEGAATESVTVLDGGSLREHWSLTLPFSPGYGLREFD